MKSNLGRKQLQNKKKRELNQKSNKFGKKQTFFKNFFIESSYDAQRKLKVLTFSSWKIFANIAILQNLSNQY
jgi:hypothetical protein